MIIVGIGAKVFAASSFAIWLVLMGSIASVFGSLLFGGSGEVGHTTYGYTGPSVETLEGNLWPRFVPDPDGGDQTFFTLFALLFPACTGIMAGANMSGDLKSPSRSIPRGTIYALIVSYLVYSLLMLFIALAIKRHALVKYYSVLQYTSFFQPVNQKIF